MRIAIVDDDPLQALLIRELSDASPHDFVAHHALDDLLRAGPCGYELIFLDCRLPPFRGYDETLPQLESAGYRGRVILMSAEKAAASEASYGFSVTGPVDKIKLLDPAGLAALIKGDPLAGSG